MPCTARLQAVRGEEPQRVRSAAWPARRSCLGPPTACRRTMVSGVKPAVGVVGPPPPARQLDGRAVPPLQPAPAPAAGHDGQRCIRQHLRLALLHIALPAGAACAQGAVAEPTTHTGTLAGTPVGRLATLFQGWRRQQQPSPAKTEVQDPPRQEPAAEQARPPAAWQLAQGSPGATQRRAPAASHRMYLKLEGGCSLSSSLNTGICRACGRGAAGTAQHGVCSPLCPAEPAPAPRGGAQSLLGMHAMAALPTHC